jgi:hypothetical protein
MKWRTLSLVYCFPTPSCGQVAVVKRRVHWVYLLFPRHFHPHPDIPIPHYKMTLTEQHIDIISKRPLNLTLDFFRHRLRDATEFDDPGQEDVADLLSALVGSTAAFSLPSPNGSGNMAIKLFSIQQHVRAGVVQLDQFRPLIRHVVVNSPDIDIWSAIFDLITALSPSTPPPSNIRPTFKGTPIKSSSS